MKLLLDIGNTRIKWAWQRGAELLPGGAVVHKGHSTVAALETVPLNAAPLEVWAASVAGPSVQSAVTDWAATRCNAPLHWAQSTSFAAGVHNGYARPERLGVDRWLAVIGGYHRVRNAAFIVDAGTALTIDVVAANGRHLGGLIAPGVQTQRSALRQATELPLVESDAGGAILAHDTNDAIAWGTLHAAVGLVARVHAGLAASMGPLPVLLTGGEAQLLLAHLSGQADLVPDLVLEGLARVAAESH